MEFGFGTRIYFTYRPRHIMNEKELIKIIKSTLNSKYIGDDCAYLEDLGICNYTGQPCRRCSF